MIVKWLSRSAIVIGLITMIACTLIMTGLRLLRLAGAAIEEAARRMR